jgi:hypothetical protein
VYAEFIDWLLFSVGVPAPVIMFWPFFVAPPILGVALLVEMWIHRDEHWL